MSVVRKPLQSKIPVLKKYTKQIITLSNCLVCRKKKSTFIKNKKLRNFHKISNDFFKMNKIINKLLLTGDKFMSEFH